MAEKNLTNYGFFDYSENDTDIYEYTADEMSTVLKSVIGNGVVPASGNYKAFATTISGLKLTVDTGIAFVNGRWCMLNSSTTLTTSASASGKHRYESLAIEVDESSRVLKLVTVTGAQTSTSEVPPVPTMADNQLQLYTYKVTASAATLLTDKRKYIYTASDAAAKINTLTTQVNGKANLVHKHERTELDIYVSETAPTSAPDGSIWIRYN